MTNNRYTPYWELCEDIDIWKSRYESYKAQYNAIIKMARLEGPQHVKGIDYTQPRVTSSGNQMDILNAIELLSKLESHLYLHSEAIMRMEEEKLNMEKSLKDFIGLEYKVMYLRDIEGKSLINISKELGYSYDYIKEISARNNKTHY